VHRCPTCTVFSERGDATVAFGRAPARERRRTGVPAAFLATAFLFFSLLTPAEGGCGTCKKRPPH
jgi:hypothetical protein